MPAETATTAATEIEARRQQLPQVRVTPPGPRSRELAAQLAALESPSVEARRRERAEASGADTSPIVYERGEGSNVYDVDGNRYVDLAAGFGALLLGHGSGAIRATVEHQNERLALALGDVFPSSEKVGLCQRLASLMPGSGARVMLGSSGADAVTAALKTAMLATGRAGVLAFDGAYHGLSHGPLAACGLRPAFREPFAAQLGDHVRFAPYPGDAAALSESLSAVKRATADGRVGAVLVEPILGRGGCVVPPAGFLEELRADCDKTGALLVCDEIWTGLGRSGAWLASVAAGVTPDVLCLGKGLGGGLPMSACVGTERAMSAWGAHGGSTIHTGTHFGAPLACAAAGMTLDILTKGALPDRARRVGERWMERLRSKGSPGVREVRGRGLMVGVALDGGGARAGRICRALLAAGWIVLTGGAEGDVLTLTPPLDISEGLLDAFVDALHDALRS